MNEPLLDDESGFNKELMMGHRKKKQKLELYNPFKWMLRDKLLTAQQDPMVKLGFGVCAYRDIIWRLFCLFLLISIMVYPQIKAYAAG